MGRAARHKEGTVILYGDKISRSMKLAIDETKRRRSIQEAYNIKHNMVPQTIVKKISEFSSDLSLLKKPSKKSPLTELNRVADLKQKMREAAENLNFELAALYRDQLDERSN
jgi:excinuclease ABC subunit B